MRLFTVGYEGSTIDEFTEVLKKNRVKCVADLRKNPVSRKRGFSKKLLGENLKAKGIEYIHFPGLGTPTEWRKSAQKGLISRERMFRDYAKKIIPKNPQDIEKLQNLMRKKGLALLCYEADASDCHRSYVADKLARNKNDKVKVINLTVQPLNKKIQLFK